MKTDIINCPFCYLDKEREIIIETPEVYAIYDLFPVSKGHALIILKRHCSNYFDLTTKEQIACWEMVNKIALILNEKFHPDGFNIGININKAGGQTIPHIHIHIIPRYLNDMRNPEGGVRGVIPNKRKYKSIEINSR